MDREADVVVVGAGIVGLAFAWEAARRGQSVALLEQSTQAEGASIRNFGMVWPIGQPPGQLYQLALQSRDRWLEARSLAKLDVDECGSIHAVYELDELAVLHEFVKIAQATGVTCSVVSAEEALRRWPHLQPVGLKGVLHSPTELCVNPRQAIDRLAIALSEQYDIKGLFHTAVTGIEMPFVHTAGGDRWRAERVFVCTGANFQTLFPTVFAGSGIRRCKLQMLRTHPQPGNWQLGSHVAGPLTLLHYRSFANCPTLPKLRARLTAEKPEYVRYGIHVMASQHRSGEVTLGDSHEYDHSITPFDSDRINQLILSELQRILVLPDWRIEQTWNGIYAKHPTQPLYLHEPQPNCHIVNALGGAGMTMSFGFARAWYAAHDAGRAFTIPE